MQQNKAIGLLSIPVIVAALGYFVDIYDLLLFSIIRIKSLKGLGLSDALCDSEGRNILSIQMYGLLIGGVVWGILGDKKGRLSVLFGSIILYSLANIANGFVQTVPQYEITRFIAGIGLAGELGAGITLVSELVSKENRGKATSIMAGIGLTGAIAAYFVAHLFDWRICFYVGGGLGLGLLLLRVRVFESGLYMGLQNISVNRGNIFMFFTNRKRFKTYILAILIGLPTWYVIGILVTFSREFSKYFGFGEHDAVDPGKAVMLTFMAASLGGLFSGYLSNMLKSRKKAFYIFYAIIVSGIVLFFCQKNGSAAFIYAAGMIMGFGTGFWPLMITMTAEHFGTNLRATAATTVPNIVRGMLPVMIILFDSLKPGFGYVNAGAITGIIIMAISITAVVMTSETFGKDLNFIEE